MQQTIYVLKSLSHGVIAYSCNKKEILTIYNQETNNGKYAGYSVQQVTTDKNINLDNVNDRLYLS